MKLLIPPVFQGFPVALVVKKLPASAGGIRDVGSILGLRRLLWRRKCQPTPVFLPGKPHAQRSLVGYIVHAFARSQTQLKGLSTSISD